MPIRASLTHTCRTLPLAHINSIPEYASRKSHFDICSDLHDPRLDPTNDLINAQVSLSNTYLYAEFDRLLVTSDLRDQPISLNESTGIIWAGNPTAYNNITPSTADGKIPHLFHQQLCQMQRCFVHVDLMVC